MSERLKNGHFAPGNQLAKGHKVVTHLLHKDYIAVIHEILLEPDKKTGVTKLSRILADTVDLALNCRDVRTRLKAQDMIYNNFLPKPKLEIDANVSNFSREDVMLAIKQAIQTKIE